MQRSSDTVVIKGTMLIMVVADTVDPEITRVVPRLTAILRRQCRRAVVAVVEQTVQSVSLRRTWKPTQVVIQQRFQGLIQRRPLELSRGHQRCIITMVRIMRLPTTTNMRAAARGAIRQAQLL